eukprot:5884540-Alexandrium_andersonii.AAC.1
MTSSQLAKGGLSARPEAHEAGDEVQAGVDKAKLRAPLVLLRPMPLKPWRAPVLLPDAWPEPPASPPSGLPDGAGSQPAKPRSRARSPTRRRTGQCHR